MARALLNRQGTVPARAEKDARKNDGRQGATEEMRPNAMVPSEASVPRPEDFAVAAGQIKELDMRRTPVDERASPCRGSGATAGDSKNDAGAGAGALSIDLIPKDPAHVKVTKGVKVRRAGSPAGETAPETTNHRRRALSTPIEGLGSEHAPIGAFMTEQSPESDLSNLIEQFEAPLALCDAPECQTIAPVTLSQAATPLISSPGPSVAAQTPEERLPATIGGLAGRAEKMSAGPAVRLERSIAEPRASGRAVRGITTVPIERLHPNRLQPRRRFDEEGIRALADSLKENGMLQPILVRQHLQRPREFEIVVGERRFRAAKQARLAQVPVVLCEISDCEALELALVENIQRQDLTPLEKAEGYQRLINDFDYTQEGLARVLSQSRSHISNTLRLLNLPPMVKEMLLRVELTAGHARALLNAERPEALARKIVVEGLSVRQTELLVRKGNSGDSAHQAEKGSKKAEIERLEEDLCAVLGLKVTISLGHRGGSLTINYTKPEELEDIVRRLYQGTSSWGQQTSLTDSLTR